MVARSVCVSVGVWNTPSLPTCPGLKKKIERGTLAMANSGKNSNTSQYFFYLSETENKKMEGKHTVFGTVVSGLDVLDKLMTRLKTDKGEGVNEKCVVSDCGKL